MKKLVIQVTPPCIFTVNGKPQALTQWGDLSDLCLFPIEPPGGGLTIKGPCWAFSYGLMGWTGIVTPDLTLELSIPLEQPSFELQEVSILSARKWDVLRKDTHVRLYFCRKTTLETIKWWPNHESPPTFSYTSEVVFGELGHEEFVFRHRWGEEGKWRLE